MEGTCGREQEVRAVSAGIAAAEIAAAEIAAE